MIFVSIEMGHYLPHQQGILYRCWYLLEQGVPTSLPIENLNDKALNDLHE